jgi:microtubule-associated protein, RP/EB family
MARVKMNARHEYEFIANFKVLQNVFKAKKIEKARPFLFLSHLSATLINPIAHTHRKTREMQNAVTCLLPTHLVCPLSHPQPFPRDNLEFLQWMKRFWDSNYGGHPYDAVARRRGAPTDTPATIAPLAPTRSSGNLAVGARPGGKTPVGGHRAGSAQPSEAVQGLQAQVREMSAHLEGLEKERDFYFAKVRCSGYFRCVLKGRSSHGCRAAP